MRARGGAITATGAPLRVTSTTSPEATRLSTSEKRRAASVAVMGVIGPAYEIHLSDSAWLAVAREELSDADLIEAERHVCLVEPVVGNARSLSPAAPPVKQTSSMREIADTDVADLRLGPVDAAEVEDGRWSSATAVTTSTRRHGDARAMRGMSCRRRCAAACARCAGTPARAGPGICGLPVGDATSPATPAVADSVQREATVSAVVLMMVACGLGDAAASSPAAPQPP
jgi:hypothetical protein